MTEELVVRYCSPTLAGLKTGNMFRYRFESQTELKNAIRSLNRKLAGKGLRVLLLKTYEENALIYVYRPEKLAQDFSDETAAALLKKYGYPCGKPQQCILKLISRLRADSTFPHEIGLFLGYPPEDVKGFITHHAKCEKCAGYWKVYGDEKKAKRLFAKYRECTADYVRRFVKGNTIEQLTVAI